MAPDQPLSVSTLSYGFQHTTPVKPLSVAISIAKHRAKAVGISTVRRSGSTVAQKKHEAPIPKTIPSRREAFVASISAKIISLFRQLSSSPSRKFFPLVKLVKTTHPTPFNSP
jgi:hypothetical protein